MDQLPCFSGRPLLAFPCLPAHTPGTLQFPANKSAVDIEGSFMKMQLGDIYKDKVTGFVGVAVSFHQYLNGCQRLALQPQELHDWKPIESQVFDVEQLEHIGPGVSITPKPTGGPRDVPARQELPKR